MYFLCFIYFQQSLPHCSPFPPDLYSYFLHFYLLFDVFPFFYSFVSMFSLSLSLALLVHSCNKMTKFTSLRKMSFETQKMGNGFVYSSVSSMLALFLLLSTSSFSHSCFVLHSQVTHSTCLVWLSCELANTLTCCYLLL